MIRLRLVGDLSLAMPLVTQLQTRGGVETDSNPDLILLGSDSVAHASSILDSSASEMRSRTLIVGLNASLKLTDPREPGSLYHLVETYRPFGVLRRIDPLPGRSIGFVGTKELAEFLQLSHGKLHSSRHYSSWIECPGEDAAEFILLVLKGSRALADSTRSDES